MMPKQSDSTTTKKAGLQVPRPLRVREQSWPIVHVEVPGRNLWRNPSATSAVVNHALYKAIGRVHDGGISGRTLLKVHIGEPKCVTRMRPEYMIGSLRFARENGAVEVVAGDTTVAYSGPRGHKDNPPADVSAYLELARKHGWSRGGPAGLPFVVLDRPGTGTSDEFTFTQRAERRQIEGINCFNDFFLAGGFAAADFVVNHAHLTLHGLAGLAGCVKSIAMGCSGLTGKLRMHQSLLPIFDAERCVRCGQCVDSCPQGALQLRENDSHPTVEPELCIGCGECEAVCAMSKEAIRLQCHDISDWQRGNETLPMRMADYAVGIMNDKWDSTVHVLHMYAVTRRCDCVDVRQQPLIETDLGFLVGKNPFAIDKLAGQLLHEAAERESQPIENSLLEAAETTAGYVQQAYGILDEVPIEKMVVS